MSQTQCQSNHIGTSLRQALRQSLGLSQPSYVDLHTLDDPKDEGKPSSTGQKRKRDAVRPSDSKAVPVKRAKTTKPTSTKGQAKKRAARKKSGNISVPAEKRTAVKQSISKRSPKAKGAAAKRKARDHVAQPDNVGTAMKTADIQHEGRDSSFNGLDDNIVANKPSLPPCAAAASGESKSDRPRTLPSIETAKEIPTNVASSATSRREPSPATVTRDLRHDRLEVASRQDLDSSDPKAGEGSVQPFAISQLSGRLLTPESGTEQRPVQAEDAAAGDVRRSGRDRRSTKLFKGFTETPLIPEESNGSNIGYYAGVEEKEVPTASALKPKPIQKRPLNPRQSQATKRKAKQSSNARTQKLRGRVTMNDPSSQLLSRSAGRMKPKKARKTPSKSIRKQSSLLVRLPTSTMGKTTDPLLTPQNINSSGLEALEDVEPTLLQLARDLTFRHPLGSKPNPRGQPLVWADSRQALCETVPYFKKPQGGCHQNDRHVYAFLFDGVGHCREYLDADIVIARAGGGMEYDADGQMVQKKNQLMTDSQVEAVLNDIKHQNPLVLICGDKNAGTLTRMPHKYCVLGWYKPVTVWAEKTAGKGKKAWTTIKYRFERLDDSKGNRQPWHAPLEVRDYSADVSTAGAVISQICGHCRKKFPQVYLVGWMCLNADCTQFWKLHSGKDASCGFLTYNPAFLLDRTSWENEVEPYSVRPPLPNLGNALGDNLTYVNTRGVCCPECGRCNPRYLFRGWRCDNPRCNWEGYIPIHQPIMPAALHSPWDSVGDGPSLARNKHEASVDLKVHYAYGYKVYTYTFNGIDGRFIHAVANSKINQEPKGPNDMLRALQPEDMGLERRRFNSEKMSARQVESTPGNSNPGEENALPTPPHEHSPELSEEQAENHEVRESQKPDPDTGDFMTAFSMNYGMPYKFVASGASRPFEKAPEPVRACRSRLNWAARSFLPGLSLRDDFNEELIFAYMEGQKIEYHDDGEEGLGPRIATLSLGGKARMHMRMKQKHFVGCSKTGLFTPECPIPGGIGGIVNGEKVSSKHMYEKRLAAWNQLQQLRHADAPAYQRRLREIPKELGIFEKRNKKADDLVTVTLSHGDIILMDGYDLQKYLEHKVVPEGLLRFALTCRTVLAHHLKPEERPAYEVKPDDYGYDGSLLH